MSTLTWENETRPNGATNTARLAMQATRCSVDDCDKPAIARGWCTAHWTRWKRHGDPLAGGPARQPAPPECTADDCHNPPYVRGLCATHWRRDQAEQDPAWRERHLAQRRDWQASNPEKVIAARRRSSAANREAILERQARWRAENRHQVLINNWKSRRRAHGLPLGIVEPVYPDVLFERDGGVCQLCGTDVDPDLPATNPMSATTDHVIPVTDPRSEHSYANTQLAHFDCNRRKNATQEDPR